MDHTLVTADDTTASQSRSTCGAWFLVGRLGMDDTIRHIPIRSARFEIGRRADAMLSIPDLKVSNRHALVYEEQGSLRIKDLGSTNGTYVNGERLTESRQLLQDDLLQFGDVTLRLLRQDVVNDIGGQTACADIYERALTLVQFDKLFKENGVIPHFQPIVDFRTECIVGYEVLGRSNVLGLESAGAMFHAARLLDLERELSNMLRWKGVEVSAAFPEPPHLFLNTHPSELDGGILPSLGRLRELNRQQELTLEIHESAITDVVEMTELRAALSDLNIKLAYDDFGAGQDRLRELADAPPDYLKFDISLIHELNEATVEKQRLIASLVNIVRDLQVIPLAEGIETKEEADVCREIGFELGQGFYCGRPTPIQGCV